MKSILGLICLTFLTLFSCTNNITETSAIKDDATVSNRDLIDCINDHIICSTTSNSPVQHDTILEYFPGCTVHFSWKQKFCKHKAGAGLQGEFHLIFFDLEISPVDCPDLTNHWDTLPDNLLEEEYLEFYEEASIFLDSFLVYQEWENGAGPWWCDSQEELFFTDLVVSNCQQLFVKQGEQIYNPGSLEQMDFLNLSCGTGCCVRSTRYCAEHPDEYPIIAINVEYENNGQCFTFPPAPPEGYRPLGNCQESVICDE